MSIMQRYTISLTPSELEYLYFLVENETLYSDRSKSIFNELESAYNRMKDDESVDRLDPNRQAFINSVEQY